MGERREEAVKILLQTGEYEYSSELGENYDILLTQIVSVADK